MIDVALSEGYAGATIARVISEAGVSRPTFYDYFTDKDDCFLAALAEIHERVLAEIRQAVAGQAPQHASDAAIGVLVGFASSHAPLARLLMNESMAAGPRALDARDQGIAEIEQTIGEAYGRLSSATAIPDLSGRMMLGGIYRLLAARLRRSEPCGAGLLDEVLDWVNSYEQPAGEHRWRMLTPAPGFSPSPLLPKTPMRPPPALAPGRTRLSKEEVSENHRIRILFAATQVAQEKGYTATTIADITSIAGVDRRVFGALFADKQDVFMTIIHEFGFQGMMGVAAGAFAYFAVASWPERVWEAGRAAGQFLRDNPSITHVGAVEAYAVGPGAINRLDELAIAFTIFLQQGYEYARKSHSPSRVALEAIGATSFELCYLQARTSESRDLLGLLPHSTHLALAPFLGASEANRFIEEKLAEEKMNAQP